MNKRLADALAEVLKHLEICEHTETHRGGAIWTICDACGKQWADDRGGFEPYVEPAWLTEAQDALHQYEVSTK